MNHHTLLSSPALRTLSALSLLLLLGACWPEQEDRTACTSNSDCFVANGETCVQGVCTEGGSTTPQDNDAGGDTDNDADNDVETDVETDTPGNTCERGFGFISGRILDQETGEGIANASVSTRPVGETVTSQADGTYIIEASYDFDTSYTLVAERAGWHAREIPVLIDCNDPTSNTKVDAQLIKRAITGRILDGTLITGTEEEIGTPIAGAQIFITGGQFVLSDENGFFTFQDDLPVTRDTFDLTVEKDLYRTEALTEVKLGEDPDNPNPNLNIKLECRATNQNACGGCGLPEPTNAPGADCSNEESCTDPQVAEYRCVDEQTTQCQCVDP